MNGLAKDVAVWLKREHLESTALECADETIRNRLADSLLREATGFHNRRSAPTQPTERRLPPPARAWLRNTVERATASSLPQGLSIIAGDGRWAACVLGYLGNSQPKVMSFAYWILTSAESRVCGGASLDLTNENDPYWGFWIQ